MACTKGTELKIGTKWLDGQGRQWEIWDTLPGSIYRVRTTDFSRTGEMYGEQIRADMERGRAVTKEIIDHDPDGDERADAQEAALNEAMGVRTGPVDGPWIVDECNTVNGVGYFVNHLWDKEVKDGDNDTYSDETHTDEVCEVCMDYKGTRSLDTANLIAAAPDMRIALEVCKVHLEQVGHSRHDSTPGGVALALVLNAISKSKGLADA